jgi:hypothetical protein
MSISTGMSGKESDRCTLFFNLLLKCGTFLFEAAVRRLKPLEKLTDVHLVAYKIISKKG